MPPSTHLGDCTRRLGVFGAVTATRLVGVRARATPTPTPTPAPTFVAVAAVAFAPPTPAVMLYRFGGTMRLGERVVLPSASCVLILVICGYILSLVVFTFSNGFKTGFMLQLAFLAL